MKTGWTVYGFLALPLLITPNPSLARDQVREELHKSFPLATNGVLSLDNVNGHVHITVWDKAEISIDAVKSAKRQAELDAVEILIKPKSDHIRVETKYSHSKGSFWRNNNSASVDYDIKVPSYVTLDKVQNVNGDVRIQGVRGTVDSSTVNGKLVAERLSNDAALESVNGSVQAGFDNVDSVKRASIKTVNGKVELNLPMQANADISAHTLNGGIEATGNLAVKKKWPVGTDLNDKLGKGGARFTAETVNGAIRIRQAQVAATSSKPAVNGSRPQLEDP
jgi:DUF4097 and DUF4098 domain-containing protein YvlB